MDNDVAWMQASLPVGSGGLGVRSATQLAPSAFLALAAGCTSIIHKLLPPRPRKTAYHAQENILQVWSEGLDASTPPAADAPRQKAWDAPQVAASVKALQEAAPDISAQARFLAASSKEVRAWLQALLVSSLGLHMEDDVFRVAAAINDVIKRSLGVAKISAHLEPVGICRSDRKGPDGATLLPWKSGRILVWDATCPDTFAPLHIDLAAREAGAVADKEEERKKAKYAELATTHLFIPLAVETTRVFGSEAWAFF